MTGVLFHGKTTTTVDAQGRVTLGRRIMERVRVERIPSFMLVGSIDGCLYAYPYSIWEATAEKEFAESHPILEPDRRDAERLYYVAEEVIPDKTGRILIPPDLREFAGLDKDVVVVGIRDRVEVWSVDRWTKRTARVGERFLKLASASDSRGTQIEGE